MVALNVIGMQSTVMLCVSLLSTIIFIVRVSELLYT
jgi:hypothetical protein